MDQTDEQRKKNQVAITPGQSVPPAEDTPQPVEAESVIPGDETDHLPPAGLDPAGDVEDPDRITAGEDLLLPYDIADDPATAEEPDPNAPDTTQRPSAPIPGASPSLRPGSGGGESRFNDPGAIKSHIHDLEHVAPRERAAALEAEQAEAKAAEERQMHDQAEQLERDKSAQELSPEDQARYFGAADPAATEPTAEQPSEPAANPEQPPAPPAANADPAGEAPATADTAEEPRRADARELARAYREQSQGDASVSQAAAPSRNDPAPADARDIARSYRESESTKPSTPEPDRAAQPRPGIDID